MMALALRNILRQAQEERTFFMTPKPNPAQAELVEARAPTVESGE